jgi:Fur family ferric uptake transcriptional regulator
MTRLASLVQRLEMAGHRVTPSRRAVVAAVARAGSHFTVDDISRRLPDVGRATVFRTMKLLLGLGVVCRVLLEDGSLHYRLSPAGAGEHHHHLVCSECGRVEDFFPCDVALLTDELARRTSYEIEGHWLELYGRCGACRVPKPAETG